MAQQNPLLPAPQGASPRTCGGPPRHIREISHDQNSQLEHGICQAALVRLTRHGRRRRSAAGNLHTAPASLDSIELGPYKPWLGESYTATALRPPRVVRLSNRVEVEWYEQVEPHRGRLGPRQMPASGIGLWDAATVTAVDGGVPLNVVSMYAAWQRSHPNVGSRSLYPDATAHRIISDLTVLVPSYSGDGPEHRIVAAGDLNVCFGDSSTFTSRAQTIIDRMAVLGLEYVGPRYPDGRKADPVPENLTEGSLDVPTYHTATKKPETAELQLGHVFASRALTKDVTTRAMNHVQEWGSSDHCRIIINVETTP